MQKKSAKSVETASSLRANSTQLPAGYVSTNSLSEADKYDAYQKNGNIALGDDGESFSKTAEWTDKLAGKAKIQLRYRAAETEEPTSAVYVFGNCYAHGFNATVAKNQILDLLNHYNKVDCITTYHPSCDLGDYGGTVESYYKNSIKISSSFSSSDPDVSSKIDSFLSTGGGKHVFAAGIHATGTLALKYLQEYLQNNTPSAIFVVYDGSISFQNDTYANELDYVSFLLSGRSYSSLSASNSYDLFDISMDTMRKIGEYQKAGCYYVCNPSSLTGQGGLLYNNPTQCNYNSSAPQSIWLAYYSVATYAPYYFANHNQELRDYFNNRQVENYSYFTQELPNAPEIINYSQTFSAQNIRFSSASMLEISDTISSNFSFSQSDISVSVLDANGAVLNPQPDVSVSVSGQKVNLNVQNVEASNTVVVDIACKTTTDSFMTADGGFLNTNDGNATAKITNKTELSVESPKLYMHYAPEIPSPTKTATGGEAIASDGTHNKISHLDAYTYDVYQVIPRENKVDYFKSFSMRDEFPAGVQVKSWQVFANGQDVTSKFRFSKTTTNKDNLNKCQDTVVATYIGNLGDAAAYGVTYDFRFQVKQTEDYAYTKTYSNQASTSIEYNNTWNHAVQDGKGGVKKDGNGNPIYETDNSGTTTDSSKATHGRTTNVAQTDVVPLGSVTIKKTLPDGFWFSASASDTEKAGYTKGFVFELTNTATGKQYWRMVQANASRMDQAEEVFENLPLGTYTLREIRTLGYSISSIGGDTGSVLFDKTSGVATITIVEGKKDISATAENSTDEHVPGVHPGESVKNNIPALTIATS